MANIIKNLLDSLKLGDDDDFDYDDDFEEEDEIEPVRPAKRERLEKVEKIPHVSESRAPKSSYEKPLRDTKNTETKKERQVHMERTSSNKIVPIRTTTKGLEVCIMKPVSFEDSQDICDMLLTGRAVVVNLEGFDPLDAQRIMDFISGAVYAINGKLHQISRFIFIFSPDNIDISGDFQELLPDDGFGVPTLNKEF